MRSSFYVFLYQGDGLEAAVIAGDVGHGGMTGQDEMVDVERLANQEERGDERVAYAQFGIK